MFKDFYEKNIYKKFYKKTTPEEKKEVVKNTGDWFPEEHENKIKGMDNVVANYSHIGAEKRPTKPGNTIKNCEVCGKEFECYRNVGKYCKECSLKKQKEYDAAYKSRKYAEKKEEEARIHNNALKRAKQRGTTYEYEVMKIKKGIDPLRAPNKKNKTDKERRERSNELGKKYRRENKLVMTPVGEADLHTRECASKRASIRGTEYLDELKKIIDGTEPIRERCGNPNFKHATTVIETKDKVEPEPQELQEPQVDYLEIMQKAIAIVKAVKATEDVKECVNSVYDILSKGE